MSKTKNKLTDLNNLLFEQVERLNDDDLKGDDLKEALAKANCITRISQNIIQNANTILRAAELADNRMDLDNKAPELLIGDVMNE